MSHRNLTRQRPWLPLLPGYHPRLSQRHQTRRIGMNHRRVHSTSATTKSRQEPTRSTKPDDSFCYLIANRLERIHEAHHTGNSGARGLGRMRRMCALRCVEQCTHCRTRPCISEMSHIGIVAEISASVRSRERARASGTQTQDVSRHCRGFGFVVISSPPFHKAGDTHSSARLTLA